MPLGTIEPCGQMRKNPQGIIPEEVVICANSVATHPRRRILLVSKHGIYMFFKPVAARSRLLGIISLRVGSLLRRTSRSITERARSRVGTPSPHR